MSACISDFSLDDLEIHGHASAQIEEHLRACRRCQERRRARAEAVARFRDVWADGVWAGVAQQQTGRRRWRRLGWFGLPALTLGLGAAASFLLMASPALRTVSSPSPSAPVAYVAAKGRALAEVVCRRGGRTFLLAPGDDVHPGDELRFRPLPAWPDARYIQVGSVDGTGAFTPFYPADLGAPSLPLPPDGDALAGSIRLDDAPGPERVLVVLSASPLLGDEVRRAAEANAATQAEMRRIADVTVMTGWIVLPKRADR